MDSREIDRYSEVMRSLRVLFVFCVTAVLAFIALPAQPSDTPVLAVLEYSGGLFAKRADIRATRGTTKSAYADFPNTVWVLREGTTLKQEHAPEEYVIHLLRSAGDTSEVVGSVVVHYVRTQKGWRPTYFLQQPPPPFTWDGQRPIPLPNTNSSREFLQTINKTDQNIGGFYPNLIVGFASGPSHIDGWTVQ